MAAIVTDSGEQYQFIDREWKSLGWVRLRSAMWACNLRDACTDTRGNQTGVICCQQVRCLFCFVRFEADFVAQGTLRSCKDSFDNCSEFCKFDKCKQKFGTISSLKYDFYLFKSLFTIILIALHLPAYYSYYKFLNTSHIVFRLGMMLRQKCGLRKTRPH